MLRTEVLEAKSLIEQKFVVRDRKCAPVFSDKKVDLYGKDIGMMVGKLYTYRDISVRDHEDYCEMTTDGEFVYFVHSYYLQADEMSDVVATTEYGVTVHAAVERDNVFACQFHPEKSSDVGMKILKNFIEL